MPALILFVCLFALSLLLNIFLWVRHAEKRAGVRAGDDVRVEPFFPEGGMLQSPRAQLDELLERITRNNRLLESLRERLVQLEPVAKAAQMQKMQQMLDRGMRAEEDWALFLVLFQRFEPEFWQALHRVHPQLQVGELRLIALIRLDWKQSELPGLLNMGEEGVRKAVYRLRKKMRVPAAIPFRQYLMEDLFRDR